MILKLSQQKRPKKPEGAAQLGLTTPIWETVETCWKTRPSDRLIVTQVLEIWEKEINDSALLAAAEQGGRRRSRVISGLNGGKKSLFVSFTFDSFKLIGSTLGGNVPWWKFVCGGSEEQYA